MAQASDQSYIPKLYIKPTLNHCFLDLSGTIEPRIIICVGRLPQLSSFPEHEQPVIVQRNKSILDAVHSLKNGTLRVVELGPSRSEPERAHFLDLDFSELPDCSESTVQLKAGGRGPDRINKRVLQEIEYPIDVTKLHDFKADTFYRLVFTPKGHPLASLASGDAYSGEDVGLNWWKKADSAHTEGTIPQVRVVRGPVFRAKTKVEPPPKFRYEIAIEPAVLSLSKPVRTSFTVKVTLMEDEMYTVECKKRGPQSIFGDSLSLFSLVLVDSSTDEILSGDRYSCSAGLPIEKVGYRRSGFKEFRPGETHVSAREIEADEVKKCFEQGLKSSSLESLKNRPLSLRLRTAGLLGIPGCSGDEVLVWWTRKSLDEMFGQEEVVFNTGDRIYMYKLTLPSDVSASFSAVD